jgi:hypothetical protein
MGWRPPGRLRTVALALLLGLAGGSACALTPPVQAEVDALLSRLEASGCMFQRNGSWYPAAEAKSHLLRKLQYLDDRGMVQSAEQFIALAASSSSTTGAPYFVQCGTEASVRSETWLLAQLRAVRAAPRAGTAR